MAEHVRPLSQRHPGRSGNERLPLHHRRVKRARQLQAGARSFLPSTSKKPTVMAVEEVRRGLVQYSDPMLNRDLLEPVEEA